MTLHAVVTTIQPPTPSLRALADHVEGVHARLVVVGDAKGPESCDLPATDFLPLDAQRALPWELARLLPTHHYARKNVGYLTAVAAGADVLYETDDDNAPTAEWRPRALECHAVPVRGASGWVNVYRAFTDQHIWPRGLPLDALDRAPEPAGGAATVRAPIQQGLADGSPDVDAVWRLVLDRPFRFDGGPSVHLPPGCWCPFNSQSTWWWPEAYPLLYLPSFCSFRMTDIWRSFVAQRCLWELGAGVVFHAPEVFQERNEHDLMRDFEAEVPGYLDNRRIAETLDALTLSPGTGAVSDNLLACYGALASAGVLEARELTMVRAWLDDLATAGGATA